MGPKSPPPFIIPSYIYPLICGHTIVWVYMSCIISFSDHVNMTGLYKLASFDTYPTMVPGSSSTLGGLAKPPPYINRDRRIIQCWRSRTRDNYICHITWCRNLCGDAISNYLCGFIHVRVVFYSHCRSQIPKTGLADPPKPSISGRKAHMRDREWIPQGYI